MKLRALASGVLLAGAVVAACSGDEGEPGPSTGTSTSSSGNTTSTSSSSSSSGSSGQGTGDGGAAPGDGGTGSQANGAVGCKDGTECASGVCFAGNAQSFCTVKCTTENATTVCVAPLTGTCNKQGFCKRD